MNHFFNCYSLKKIDIPDSVEHMSWRAFHSCRSLEEITIPKRLKTIPYRCFQICASLQKVHIQLNSILKRIEPASFMETPVWKEMDYLPGYSRTFDKGPV